MAIFPFNSQVSKQNLGKGKERGSEPFCYQLDDHSWPILDKAGPEIDAQSSSAMSRKAVSHYISIAGLKRQGFQF